VLTRLATASKGTRLLLAVMLLVGAMVVIVAWGSELDGRLRDFDRGAARVLAPGTVRLNALAGADYTVYLDRRDPTLSFTVTGPDGRGVPVEPAPGQYRRGRALVSSAVTFTATESGPHAVLVEGGDGMPNTAFAADVNVPRERAHSVLLAVVLWLSSLLAAVLLVLPLMSGDSVESREADA